MSSRENTRMCCMCGSSPSKDPSISLHRFPKSGSKNALRCELWAKYCFPNEAWSSPKFQDELHTKHKMLCSKHFRATCFIEKKLFRTAVPDVQCDEGPEKTDALPVTLSSSPPVSQDHYLPVENLENSSAVAEEDQVASVAEDQAADVAFDDVELLNYSDIEAEYLEDEESEIKRTTNVNSNIDNSNYLNTDLEEEYLEEEEIQSECNETTNLNSITDLHNHSNPDNRSLEEGDTTVAGAEDEIVRKEFTKNDTNLLIYDPALQPAKDIMCSTCCSNGRTIIPLTLNRNFKLLQKFCSKIQFTEEDKICWECDAMLNKMYKFKQKVINAQKVLTNVMSGGQIVFIESLSHMKTTDISGVAIPPSSDLASSIEKPELDKRKEDSADTEWAHDYLESLPASPCDGDTEMDIDNEEHSSVPANIPPLEEPSTVPVNIPFTEKPERTNMKPKCNFTILHIPKIKEKTNAFTEPHLLKEACKMKNVSEEYLLEYMDGQRRKLVNSKRRKCLKCARSFDSVESQHRHNTQRHTNAGEHICKICEQRFHDAEILEFHYSNHFVFFECAACGLMMKGRNGMLTHFNKMHREQRRICRDCGQVFQYLYEFQRHRLAAHGPKLTCKHCGRIFRESTNFAKHLINHTRNKLRKTEQHKCRHCDETLSSLGHLQKHLVDKHGMEPENKCGACDKQFVNAKTYKNHLRSMRHLKSANQSTANYICEDCGRFFSTVSQLTAHRKQYHVYEKCICDLCNKVFISKELLIRHMKFSTKHKPNRVRNKTCELCGKSFYNTASLKAHVYIHSVDRPFMCDLCGATFRAPKGLQKHRVQVHKLGTQHRKYPTDLSNQFSGLSEGLS